MRSQIGENTPKSNYHRIQHQTRAKGSGSIITFENGYKRCKDVFILYLVVCAIAIKNPFFPVTFLFFRGF